MPDRVDDQRNCADGVATPRRTFLCVALATGIGLSSIRRAPAEDDKPGADERPREGDRFVFAEGDNANNPITLKDIMLGGPPVQAWPVEPKTKVVRDGSRLNQVVIVRLKADEFDDDTRARSADGIVAYSAICAHAGCIVSMWVEDQGKKILKCPCHDTVYEPRQGAEVVSGPAPRRLAALPVKLDGGILTVAGAFVGKLGGATSG